MRCESVRERRQPYGESIRFEKIQECHNGDNEDSSQLRPQAIIPRGLRQPIIIREERRERHEENFFYERRFREVDRSCAGSYGAVRHDSAARRSASPCSSDSNPSYEYVCRAASPSYSIDDGDRHFHRSCQTSLYAPKDSSLYGQPVEQGLSAVDDLLRKWTSEGT